MMQSKLLFLMSAITVWLLSACSSMSVEQVKINT